MTRKYSYTSNKRENIFSGKAQFTNREDILSELCIKSSLLPGCINPMTSLLENKSNESVVHSFIKQNGTEFLYSVILLYRSKFETYTEINKLIPSAAIDQRLVS